MAVHLCYSILFALKLNLIPFLTFIQHIRLLLIIRDKYNWTSLFEGKSVNLLIFIANQNKYELEIISYKVMLLANFCHLIRNVSKRKSTSSSVKKERLLMLSPCNPFRISDWCSLKAWHVFTIALVVGISSHSPVALSIKKRPGGFKFLMWFTTIAAVLLFAWFVTLKA